jgi:hypothetical protein
MHSQDKFRISKAYYGQWSVALPKSHWGRIGNTKWFVSWESALEFVLMELRDRKLKDTLEKVGNP